MTPSPAHRAGLLILRIELDPVIDRPLIIVRTVDALEEPAPEEVQFADASAAVTYARSWLEGWLASGDARVTER